MLNSCVGASPHIYKNNSKYDVNIYNELKNVKGVLDVLKVNFRIQSGTNYSGASIDINRNLSPDGNELIIPKNAIAEMKYPATDIRGKAK